MPVVKIRDVSISFPFEPYQIQKDYMEKVLECLQDETNGVLESPTGTGKTLSLLCSSLAWLEGKKAELQVQREAEKSEKSGYTWGLQEGPNDAVDKTAGRSPTIIYASRTHSQLTQVMQELKRTSYSYMKSCVLGSRDFMCVHPELVKENVQGKRIACELKVKTRSCLYYNNIERKKFDPDVTALDVIDIEDMVRLGNVHKFCPYFMTMKELKWADIIFVPYNYLLDSRYRKGIGLELSDNVVILDEAHNIEKYCEEVASLQINSSDITLAIEDVTAVMTLISNLTETSEKPNGITPRELCTLKQTLLDLEKEIDNVQLEKNKYPGEANFDGMYIFELLDRAKIKNENFKKLVDLINEIIKFLATVSDGPFAGRKGGGLQLYQNFLVVVFASANLPGLKEKINLCYKVNVMEEEGKKNKSSYWQSKATRNSGGRILSYWCFDPGFGMKMLTNCNLKSLILTSGTLAPLAPLISELGIEVRVRLENPHIVKGNQICVRIVSTGPDSEILNSNYQNRDNPKYIRSLGMAILNMCRIIPKGLLIFFPSYSAMERCARHWQETELWGNIWQLKPIIVEPRDNNAFSKAMIEYYAKVRDPVLKGAIFMGVCRGKLSEGLDFADDNARAVILTGLPYPPLMDPKIVLKRRYMDRRNVGNKERLKGDDWYSLEATRAINQAIGRVIRNGNDYGAILLLDTRFKRVTGQMSRWLQGYVKCVGDFGGVIRDLRIFFGNAAATAVRAPTKATGETPRAPPLAEAEFDVPEIYGKGGDPDSSTSSLAGTSSCTGSGGGGSTQEAVIYKRVLDNSLNRTKRNIDNVAKRIHRDGSE